ncbi:hypothetical protein ACH4FX_06875 [Streptomyces sp. NPDC018019]|uniref:hypothetical protein n=1 Tax=Streptomyces sp. NPDC018019 TaxID=3365030 RepID=UPI0037B7A9F6
MSLRDKIFGKPEDVAAHREASDELERCARAADDDTDPAYLAANERKGETAARVPSWRR